MVARRQITTAALVIMVGNAVSRLLGLLREGVMAWLFGAQHETDAFVAAFTLPTIVFDLFVGAAISAALVPVLVDVASDRARAWRLLSSLLNCIGLVLILVCALLAVLAPGVIALLGSRFDAPTQARAVEMVRPMLVAVVLQGLAGVLMANLYARERFALPAFSPAVFNAGIIVSALVLQATLGIHALVLGVVLGAAAQLALQALGQGGFSYRPVLELSPEVRGVLRLYAPVALGMLVTIVGIVIDRNLASGLEEGSMTVMNYATRLIQFPLGLVATATAFAVLPRLASQAGATLSGAVTSNSVEYRETLVFGLKIVLFLMLPATLGLVVLREPLVQLLCERGAFTDRDTARTALVFLAYAPQLPLTALDQLLIFAFYARKNTRTPVLIGVVGVGLYVAVALPAVGPLGLGAPGLALANAVQNGGHGLILLALMRREIGFFGGGLAGFASRALLASLAMGALLELTRSFVQPGLPAGGLPLTVFLLGSAVLGVGCFLLFSYALGLGKGLGGWGNWPGPPKPLTPNPSL